MFDDMISIRKQDAAEILSWLNRVASVNPNLKGFKNHKEKNNRGNYGYTEYYEYKGMLYLAFDIDGARLNGRYYKTPETKAILNTMMFDAKSHDIKKTYEFLSKRS